MRKIQMFAALCVMFFPAIGFAQSTQTKAAAAQTARAIPPPPPPPSAIIAPFGILRQDLFDRNDPNNLRSDYHGPPAQPAQY
jgi:hypothetical protein